MNKNLIAAALIPFLLTLTACGGGGSDSSNKAPEPAPIVDSDNDGVADSGDAFPNDSTETKDTDGDGVGDNSDAFPNDATETLDTDADGVGDNADKFPNDATETLDSDEDGVGDNSDIFPNDPLETVDTDGDGVGDNSDAFPNDATETLDTDADGVGDNADAFPNDPLETVDTDGDGIGDNRDSSLIAQLVEDITTVANYKVTIDSNGIINPEGRSLDYKWEIISKPSESTFSLDNVGFESSIEFTADVTGEYELRLTISDGVLNDSFDNIKLIVKEDYTIIYSLYDQGLSGDDICNLTGNWGYWYFAGCIVTAFSGAEVIVGIRNNHPENVLTVTRVGYLLESFFTSSWTINENDQRVAPGGDISFTLTINQTSRLDGAFFEVSGNSVYGQFTGNITSQKYIDSSKYLNY